MGQKLRGPRARLARLARALYPGLARVRLRGRPLAVLSVAYVLLIVASGWYLVVPRVLLYRILLATGPNHVVSRGAAGAASAAPATLDRRESRSSGGGEATDGDQDGVHAMVNRITSDRIGPATTGDTNNGPKRSNSSNSRNSRNGDAWPVSEFALLCVFNTTIVLCVISYLLTALCDPGPVPDTWRPIHAAANQSPHLPAIPWPVAATATPHRPQSPPRTPPTSAPRAPLLATPPSILSRSQSLVSADQQCQQTLLASGDNASAPKRSDTEHELDVVTVPAIAATPSRSSLSDIEPSSTARISSSFYTQSSLRRDTMHVGPPIPPPIVRAAAALGTDGNPRLCRSCRLYKPARTHHCSICQRCTLEMDHHCPFTGNNCIGFMNRKFFILFLYYATFSCTVVSVVAPSGILRAISDMEEDQSFSGIVWLAANLFGYLLCLLHALVLAIFAGFHTFLVLRNRTTIEHSDPCGDELNRFDRGALRNWRAVFGSRPFLWLLPVALGREGDGVRWRNIDEIF